MYTRQKRLAKDLQQPTNEATLLGSAVSAAVLGRTEDLLQLTIRYFHCDGAKDMSDLAALLLHLLGEIHRRADPTDQENEMIQRASQELRKSHRQFRAAMTWLCSARSPHQTVGLNSKLVASGKWEPGRYPLIDKKTENCIRFLENHGIKHFRSRLSLQDGRLLPLPRIVHWIDVFCAYVLDRCLGQKVSRMPIKICPRCGKLFASGRKRFCSEECQWNHYWTPERRADDKWVKDLEKFSKHCKPKYGRSFADLQEKLAFPKVKQRLASIKKKIEQKDWAGWGKIAQRIEEVERLAAKSE